MEPGVLIAGKPSPFLNELIEEALKRSYFVIASRETGVDEESSLDSLEGERLVYLPWQRRSLISARGLLLRAEQEREGLDSILVVASPEGVHSPLHQTESVQIEERIDESLKGYLFLVKESLAYLIRRGEGRFTFVLYDGGAEIMAPLDAAIRSALTGLMESLFEFYASEPIELSALHAGSAETGEMAQWILDTMKGPHAKREGRWVRYGRRTGLFGMRK